MLAVRGPYIHKKTRQATFDAFCVYANCERLLAFATAHPGRKLGLAGQGDNPGFFHAFDREDVGHRLGRGTGVERENADRFAAGLVRLATDRHVGDIDLVTTKHVSDLANDAWRVVMVEQQKDAVEVAFHVAVVDLD